MFHGFDNRSPFDRGIRLYLSRGRPRPSKGGNFSTLQEVNQFRRHSTATFNLYKRFGLPDKIISDQGPQFASKAFLELLKLLGIKSALSTAYHPQTVRTTERVNQEIKAYLSIYCASHPEEWPRAQHTLEFTHNNRRHADRQHTPFALMFGESPIAIPLSFENTKYPSMEDKMKTLMQNWEEALAAHELARSRMADR